MVAALTSVSIDHFPQCRPSESWGRALVTVASPFLSPFVPSEVEGRGARHSRVSTELDTNGYWVSWCTTRSMQALARMTR